MSIELLKYQNGTVGVYKDERLGFRVKVIGAVGSQVVVDCLRDEGLWRATAIGPKVRGGVIECLKAGWEEEDEFLTKGGILSSKGSRMTWEELRGINPKFNPATIPDWGKGFTQIGGKEFFALVGKSKVPPFTSVEQLQIADSGLGERLKMFKGTNESYNSLIQKVYCLLPGEFSIKAKESAHYITRGLAELMRARFEGNPELISTESAVRQRMYDHANRQVPNLDSM